MATQKDYCATLFPWLKANLGKRCLGCLSGQDTKALKAAVQIIGLYAYCDDSQPVLQAFGLVVQQMQPGCHELAFHAIAHVTDWGNRETVWQAAGLPTIVNLRVCNFEPRGIDFQIKSGKMRNV